MIGALGMAGVGIGSDPQIEEEYGLAPSEDERRAGILEQLQTNRQRSGAMIEEQNKQREAYYAQAREQLANARFGSPSRAERLLQLSSAFLSPRSQPGFAGTMQNILPEIYQQTAEQRAAEEARAEALRKLEQDQAQFGMTSQQQALENERRGLKDMLEFYKEDRVRGTHNPITGELQDPYTGEPIAPPAPPPPQAALQKLVEYINDPSNSLEDKQQTVVNFQQRFGVDPMTLIQKRR